MRTQSRALREDGFDVRVPKRESRNGNFAFGEYTHVLRLTSELVDLRTGYANPISREARGWVLRAGAKKGELQSSSPFLAPATGIEPITNP